MTAAGCLTMAASNDHVCSTGNASRGKKSSRTTFQKFVKYFTEQAHQNQNKSTALHLAPRGLQPGTRYYTTRRSLPAEGVRIRLEDRRRFSEATTFVNNDGRRFLYYQQPTLPAQQESRAASPSGSNSESSSSGGGKKMAPDAIKHQYASDNILQSYEVYIPSSTQSQQTGSNTTDLKLPSPKFQKKYWLVYIHGGYFRDVKVDSTSFRHAVTLLESTSQQPSSSSSSSTSVSSSQQQPASGTNSSNTSTLQHDDDDHDGDRIAGYASINYRLSPHPAYPQDEKTPNYELRDAHWPDQINDVLAALRHMQQRYHFGDTDQDKYILIGHSVGATLALLAALNSGKTDAAKCIDGSGVCAPGCVVGVSGIYDFPLIHKTYPSYEAMTSNAMDKTQYSEASPALHEASEYERGWEVATGGVKSVMLAHSRDDELVDWSQVDAMKDKLDEVSSTNGGEAVRTRVLELKGKHNDIWEKGTELARAIRDTLDMVAAS